jgi:hypothetical protein
MSQTKKPLYMWTGSEWILVGDGGGGGGSGGSVVGGTNIDVNYNEELNTYTVNTNSDLENIDSISTPDYIQFDTTASVNPVTGLLGWDSVEGTLNLGLSSGKHIHLGEESVFRVRNSTGSTIGKGTALYASGVEPSGRIQVTPYVANGSVREVRFMGLATESISSGVNGFVQHFGYVRDLDTRGTSSTSISVGDETWAAGDLLYVHPTVPGKLTNVKPKHEIVVAIIIIRHQSTGILFVRPTSGGHLEDIHDISLSSLSNEDILIYNSASSIWINNPVQEYLNTASAAAVEAAPAVFYQSASPTSADMGDLWIDSDGDLSEALGLSHIHGQYLASNTASATYLSIINASATYLTIVDASATYATQVDLDNIDLTSTINTASAAAYASASAYTDSEIAGIDLSPYLTVSAASATYATQAELGTIDVDNLPDIFLMMGG